jgi:hypothetical protein
MEGTVVMINGRSYTLRKFKHRAQIEIEDASWRTVMADDGTPTLERKAGTYQSLICFHSLSAWDLKNEKGEPILLNRQNFLDHLPPEDMPELVEECLKVNALTVAEKKG